MTDSNLKISTGLAFPLDAATQTFAFIGRKGSGKTYGSGKLVELLIGAGIQVAILDTVGNWYGLRLAADGKSSGIDIPILGGLRGDIPLEATGGALVADTLVDSGRSMIIDVSQFVKADRQRFAHKLGERLWQRKKGELQPSPIHLVLEESQLIVPENVRGDVAPMVGVYEEIIRLGRNYGIGVSMLSQRPQSVNKEVLNQTECLMVFQVNGAHERKALREWIVHQGMDLTLLDQLPSLQPGECFVWSPQWLQTLQKVRILTKRTFDSTKTPKAGERKVQAREIGRLDLDDLKTKMAATIERFRADDPRELRKKIAALERDLEQAKKSQSPAQIEVPVEISILKPEHEKELAALLKASEVLRDQALELRQDAADLVRANHELLTTIKVAASRNGSSPRARIDLPARQMPKHSGMGQPLPIKISMSTSGNGEVGTGGLRRMLIALAQRPQGLNVRQLGIRAGLSSKSGTFTTYLGKGRLSGWIQGSRDCLNITKTGLEALGGWDPLPMGQSLLHYWLDQLGDSGAARMLRALSEVYPRALSKQEMADRAGMTGTSGTFTTYLGRLRSLELVEGRGELRASEELFE